MISAKLTALAVGALVITSGRSRARSIVGALLVAYYSAAVLFHIRAGDRSIEFAPAAGCALVAATITGDAR